MTPVKARRGRYIHCSENLRTTVCGRRCYGWLCGTEEWKLVRERDACPACYAITTIN